MFSALDDPRACKCEAPADDEERRREEAAREVTEWLFSDQPAPTQEELDAVVREWQG